MLVIGLGMGCVMQVLVLAIQNSVPYRDLGVGTSSNAFFRSMGSSIGVAVFGALVTNMLANYVVGHTDNVTDRVKLGHALANGESAKGSLNDSLLHIFNGAYVHAINSTFLWAVPLVLIGLVLAFVLPEKRLSTKSGLGRGAAPTGGEVAAPLAQVPE